MGKYNQQTIILKFKETHKNKYNYDKVIYVKYEAKVIITCKKHGDFVQTCPSHIRGAGCPKCGTLKVSSKLKFTNKTFIKKSRKIHGNIYNYSCVDYVNNHTKITIICKSHGPFAQMPSEHLNGRYCPACTKINFSLSKINEAAKEFFGKIKNIHGNKFDYSKFNYINATTPTIIICRIHNEFLQSPSAHLAGQGCPTCGHIASNNSKRSNAIDFAKKAKIIHDNKYDYSKVIWHNADTNIIITCPKHGEFLQIPYNHLLGNGCKKCVGIISKLETQWLNFIEIPVEFRNKTLKIEKRIFKPDAFDTTTNTIYEFYGDYWHGNPRVFDLDAIHPVIKKTYGELYQKTVEKERFLISKGYNLITIWEQDFKILYGVK